MEFTYVNIKCEGCEGWLNLFYGDQCIALVKNVSIANSMRENIKEKPPLGNET